MNRTCEMRWFFRVPPVDVGSFFSADGAPDTRTDWYAFPCDERCGIKIREGRLETKLLLQDAGTSTVAGATGRIQQWEKWSAELPPDDAPGEDRLAAAGWVRVEKTRRLRMFSVDGGVVQEVPNWRQQPPATGGQFECTQVRSDGHSWWTVGFEAFGADAPMPEAQFRENLQRIVEHVFSGRRAIAAALQPSDSFAYPRWLHLRRSG